MDVEEVKIPRSEWVLICRWLHHFNSTILPSDLYADHGVKLNEWCKKNAMNGHRKV